MSLNSSQTPTMKFKYEKLKLVATCTLTNQKAQNMKSPKIS